MLRMNKENKMPVPTRVILDAPSALAGLGVDDETLDTLLSMIFECLGKHSTAISDLLSNVSFVHEHMRQHEHRSLDAVGELLMSLGRDLLHELEYHGAYALDGTLHHYYSGRVGRSVIILMKV